jgi:hypothetical protein
MNSEMTTLHGHMQYFCTITDEEIRLLTSAEDTVLCELKCGLDISSNTLCTIKGKKKLAPTPHTQSSKILWQRAKGWVYL